MRSLRHSILAAAVLLIAGATILAPPISDPTTHSYADLRAWLGIPNFFDVMSNVAFLVVGLAGLAAVLGSRSRTSAFSDPWERWPYAILFAATALVAFGSAYYHLRPDDERLVWDRLPIAVGFMGLLAAVLGERVSLPLSRALLFPLLSLGAASVLLWYAGELRGVSDLRLYVLAQGGSVLLVALLLVLYPARYSGGTWFAAALVLYGVAKGFELLDAEVLARGHTVSGHTVKHLLAAAAVGSLAIMIRVRRPLEGRGPKEDPAAARGRSGVFTA